MIREKTIHLIIAYDGSNFSGWQRQPRVRTVCGELEERLSELCRFPVTLHGASRTDAGVHALGQSAHFTGTMGIEAPGILRATNNLLAANRLEGVGEICIRSAREVPAGFHARFDAKGKRYRYRIQDGNRPDLFLRNRRYHVKENLDLAAMDRAAACLVGSHDFACFMSAGGQPGRTTVRCIHRCSVERSGEEIVFSVEGDGFLYHMVRNMVGLLVEVGRGERTAGELAAHLNSGQRQRLGHTAPPQGLYLDQVFY